MSDTEIGYAGRSFKHSFVTEIEDTLTDPSTYALVLYLYKAGAVILTKTQSSFTIITALTGECKVVLSTADTTGLSGLYSYEITMSKSGETYTVDTGVIIFKDPTGGTGGGLSDRIPEMSSYHVGDEPGNTFTTASFNRFLSDATAILDAENPGLSTASYERAQLLLVLHFYEVKSGGTDKTSESIQGKYSYTRSVPGMTRWSLEYDKLLKTAADSLNSDEQIGEGCTRADIEMTEFKLDQSPIKRYDGSDET